ncbi:hypothetical protein [Mariniblastus fucicola]|uniref:DNA-directed RNA polymerase subunit P n=1 Tax=Mariniblastus fucicola TaxID=980251 RepID=A0A5B9P7J4_9BACT|nr:hypothetical protein [Mariniblastus fucicola]QEG22304.1 DNA-directed RNA polymerase subunit P [Mariniblastus fucicola]
MTQVFGCPNCHNSFQIPDDPAGQAFQCPTCNATVEVPIVDASQNEPPAMADEPEVYRCPHCSGDFGIDASMYGQQLACPHCDQLVMIGKSSQDDDLIPVFHPQPEDVTDEPASTQSPDPSADSATEPPSLASRKKRGPSSLSEQEPADPADQTEHAKPDEPAESPEPADPVFEPAAVDHLLPPRFDVPDPVRFPSRLGSEEVILPDGAGGYQSVDANIVTITHNGEVYQLKRLTPEQRRRRKLIHNSIAIVVAVVLIYFTLRTLGVLS